MASSGFSSTTAGEELVGCSSWDDSVFGSVSGSASDSDSASFTVCSGRDSASSFFSSDCLGASSTDSDVLGSSVDLTAASVSL